MNSNYGFSGPAPPGVSVENNIDRALEYQETHSTKKTFEWFYEHVRHNKDGHSHIDESMDYKQIDKIC